VNRKQRMEPGVQVASEHQVATAPDADLPPRREQALLCKTTLCKTTALLFEGHTDTGPRRSRLGCTCFASCRDASWAQTAERCGDAAQ
jgi:hypothetical protein